MSRWREIPSFPQYEASDRGDIRRCKPGSRALSQHREKNGYWTVTLWIDGRTNSQWTHRLVCEAWHGPAPSPGHHAAHRNGDPNNCRASNLGWKTRVGNAADKKAHGTEIFGERNGQAKLTEADVRAIRRAYARLPLSSGGARIKKGAIDALVTRFGVSAIHIRGIVRGRNWSHLS